MDKIVSKILGNKYFLVSIAIFITYKLGEALGGSIFFIFH
jgi:hypothetical protein